MGEPFTDAASVLVPQAPINSPLSPCCVFVQAVLAGVYGSDVIARAPTPLWRVWPEARDAFGPLTAASRVGIAQGLSFPFVLERAPVNVWLLFQSWHVAADVDRVDDGQKAMAPGHTFVAWFPPPGGRLGRIIDSAENRGARDELIDASAWPAWFGQFAVTRAVVLRAP